jgi:hypothetical protein
MTFFRPTVPSTPKFWRNSINKPRNKRIMAASSAAYPP